MSRITYCNPFELQRGRKGCVNMSPLVVNLLNTLAALLILLGAVWLLSVWKRDASIIDPVWGTGFVVVALLSAWLNAPLTQRGTLLTVLVAIWGLRLSGYLLWRNWGHAEDYRYRAMRATHGERFWWVSLFTVFWLQAVILWLVSLPIQAALVSTLDSPWGLPDAVGCGLWLLGVFFEAVGDWQLARFKANPANTGRVMDRGLWRFTRHPNYFGDFCVWWGIYLLALASGAWWTIPAPLVMSVLLLKVSGVSLLEKTITERRPDYADYQRRTSSFFPWPPKKWPSSGAHS